MGILSYEEEPGYFRSDLPFFVCAPNDAIYRMLRNKKLNTVEELSRALLNADSDSVSSVEAPGAAVTATGKRRRRSLQVRRTGDALFLPVSPGNSLPAAEAEILTALQQLLCLSKHTTRTVTNIITVVVVFVSIILLWDTLIS